MSAPRNTDEFGAVGQTVVVAYDGPVYTPTLSPDFHADIHEAAERAWDDGLDPTKVEAFTCTVRKARTPNLVECIEESWWQEYDDPDLAGNVSKALAALLDKAQEMAEAEAPDVWVATSTPVLLPPVECPDCEVASNEPWDELRADCKFCDRPNEDDAARLSARSGDGS